MSQKFTNVSPNIYQCCSSALPSHFSLALEASDGMLISEIKSGKRKLSLPPVV